MASVLQVKGKWRALCRRPGFKSQCKTHPTKAAADKWARGIEAGWDSGAIVLAPSTITVAKIIKAYRELREESRPILDTTNEHYMLKALDRGLGHHIAATMTSDDLVTYANMRKEEGAGPYTVNMDISKLGTAMRYGSAKLKITLPDVVGAARPTLTYLRLIGGGNKRERRPTTDEFERIVAHFAEHHGPRFTDAVLFSALTAMRRGEVTAIKWVDVNQPTKIIAVLRKHPRKGKVLERVPILPPAWEILARQPKDDERVFPFDGGTLSKYFTNACRTLSIPDLHLHDLRHEGASSLFEQGYKIEQVALVTGHKDWRNLKRYTNLRPEDLTKQAHTLRPDAPLHGDSQPTVSRRPSKS